MKSAFTIWMILLCALFANANEIDTLKDNTDVYMFLYRNQLPTPNITRFFKMDIDNNGLTDLILNGAYCFAVLDTGRGNYNAPIDGGDKKHNIIDVLNTKNGVLLVSQSQCGNEAGIINDTIVFKFGRFTYYYSHPDNLKIEEINLKSDGGYGGRLFDLKIDGAGWATYTAGYSERIFAGTVDSVSFDEIIKTVNTLKLTSLCDRYQVENTTDLETFELEIKFNNGQIKKISDYGAQGIYSLVRLYGQLMQAADKLNELN